MALATLAVTADLSARGIPVTDAALVAALLASASEAVRDAAGCAISSTSSVVTVLPNRGHWLDVPGPVSAVASITVDGTAVTDFSIIGGRIWREDGWLTGGWHAPIVVTYTHGLATVPADIVDLVCSLVAGGIAAAADKYDPNRGLAYERIDDYQRGFRQGDDEVVNALLIPERTRAWLRSRFGTGVATTGVA